jgi:hypothetical protein
VSSDVLELLLLVVGGRPYALPAEAVWSVTTRLGERGTGTLPRVALGRLLAGTRRRGKIDIVLQANQAPTCLVEADEVLRVSRMPLSGLHPLPWPMTGTRPAGVFAVYLLEGDTIPVLDPQELLAAAGAAGRSKEKIA